MLTIPLTNGGETLVDDDDYLEVSGYRWHRCPKGYVIRRRLAEDGPGGHQIQMHRQIIGPGSYREIDHANCVKHDNRRSNLRPCTNRENQANRPKRSTWKGRPTSSQYKGVYWNRDYQLWVAQLFVDGRRVLHFRSASEETAARAFDEAAVLHFGEFARTNFSVQATA